MSPHRGRTGLWLVPAAALGLAAAAVGWARYVEPRRLELVEWEVPLERLEPAAVSTILHLSDLHVGRLGFGAQEFVRALGPAALSARALCLTGDFCDRSSEVPLVEAFLTPLLHAMAVHGGGAVQAYAVWGNHDRRAGQAALAVVLRRLGVAVLDNTAVRLPQGLWLAGVGDPTTRQDRLDQALAGIPAGDPFVLLAHNPAIFPRAAAAGVPLTLAGHTHGGQVRVGHWDGMVGKVSLAEPYRQAGWFRLGAQAMYVNRGLGMTFLPLRFNARPEATLFHLVPQVPRTEAATT